MTDTNSQGIKISVLTAILGWVITFGSAIAYVTAHDATTLARLDFIEKEIFNLDARLDTSESFRVTLATDLAEIKTDLLWIRRALQQQEN
tara:strand:- start:228 stop:497 length:270 start_codon:yes stop_codon:yes gene_type:complete